MSIFKIGLFLYVSSSPFPFHPVHVSGASPPDIIKNKKQEFQRHQLFFILHSSFQNIPCANGFYRWIPPSKNLNKNKKG